MNDTIGLLIVDDDPLTRVGIRTVLAPEQDIVIVGEAATARQAIALVQSLQPDVVLMDVQLPDMSGIVATEHITKAADGEGHPVSVIALTTFNYDEYVFRSLQAGASGFLLKRAPVEELINAIRVVASGEALPASAETRALIARFVASGAASTRVRSGETLTAREAEILALIAQGLSNTEIAESLHISAETVKTHAKHIYMKCGVRDRVQAVIAAFELGLAP